VTGPGLVQHASGSTVGGGAIVVTVAATGAGNMLAAVITAANPDTAPTGITTGASADNWAQDGSAANPNSFTVADYIWSDPNCAGGATSVTVTFPAGTFAAADVFEFSGMPSARSLDQLSFHQGGTPAGSVFDSLAAPATSQASEVWLAGASVLGSTTNPVITPTSPGWTSQSQINVSGLVAHMAAYAIVSATGTPEYAGTLSGSTGFYAAGVVAYKAIPPPSGAAPAAPADERRTAGLVKMRLMGMR